MWGLDSFYWERGGGGSLLIITVCDFTHPGEKPPIF